MVIVLGCGVAGMTSALVLSRAGLQVEIWAARLPPRTTSNVAAAFWYPYRAYPRKRVVRWAADSYEAFAALAGRPETGVSMRHAVDWARAPMPRPWWADAVPSLRAAEGPPPAGMDSGWAFDAPVIDTRRYLPWLLDQLESRGVVIRERKVETFASALADAPRVINCTGLGARPLCSDAELTPIRGQLVHVRNPGLEDVILDEHDAGGIAYVVPRGDDCVLGGSASEHDPRTEACPDEAAAIVQRCARLVPALADAQRLADVVGFRPGRPEVRLEAQPQPGGTVVHNYGHGGAGVTLSWGCAAEVLTLCQAARRAPSTGPAPLAARLESS